MWVKEICMDVKKLCCNAKVSRHFVTKLLAKISVTRPVKSSVGNPKLIKFPSDLMMVSGVRMSVQPSESYYITQF